MVCARHLSVYLRWIEIRWQQHRQGASEVTSGKSKRSDSYSGRVQVWMFAVHTCDDSASVRLVSHYVVATVFATRDDVIARVDRSEVSDFLRDPTCASVTTYVLNAHARTRRLWPRPCDVTATVPTVKGSASVATRCLSVAKGEEKKMEVGYETVSDVAHCSQTVPVLFDRCFAS